MKIVKKVLSLIASSLAVLIFSGFLSLQPISEPRALAHHTDTPSCRDITGVTQDVPSPQASGRQEGVADSGHLDFDADPPAHDFQACTQTQPLLADGLVVGSETVIRGWTWNSNLGYISLSCEGGNNFGTGNCGSAVDYGVTVLETGGPGEDSRRVRGFAWGDNIGWISMGCDGSGNEMRNLGFDCGNRNYGVSIADRDGLNKAECSNAANPDGSLNRGDMYGYAWTDTVGWINFCGAHADLPEEGLTATVSFPANGIKYANGSDAHEIVVRVAENDGTLIDPTQYEVTITPEWTDSVRSDQVTLCPDGTDTGCPAARFNATAKGTFSWEAGRGFVSRITSLAPTSAASRPGTDTLQLNNINITARERNPGGAAGRPVSVTQPLASNNTFSFEPPVSVLRIYSPDSSTAGDSGDSLFAQRNVPTEHIITADFHPGVGAGALTDGGAALVFTQIHDCSNAFNFIFDEQDNGVGVEDSSSTRTETSDIGDSANVDNIDRVGAVCLGQPGQTITDIDRVGAGTPVSDFLAGGVHRFIYSEVQDPTLAGRAGIETDDALGMRTRVEYTVGAVNTKYFSKTVSDSSLLNQAADVKGNVRIDVQSLDGLLGGRSEKSVGVGGAGGAGKSKSEFFNRALDNLKFVGRATAINSRVLDGANLSDVNFGVERFFKRDPNSLVGDEPCKIILRDDTDIDFSGKKTIASRGCDVYIESNIYPMAGGTLGIVALEDLDMPKTAPLKGGNVYICSRVTDLKNVHIVAENSVLPYGANESECGTLSDRIEQSGSRAGLPNFSTPDSSGVVVKPVRETLQNQLVITGSIVSNNTYGGAFKNPPEAGDGRRITDPELMDTARYYDYNFSRYAHTIPNPDPRGAINVAKCWADDIVKSKQYDPYSCRNNNPEPYTERNPGSKGIMNIQFAPPPSDLPVFNYRLK
ncbi:hypothetical protein HYW83_01580 [Candidatus Peregrinibacteria bacterium]|nr:hypothetical protein [Candidatus Peregrinibacteria bacterium]